MASAAVAAFDNLFLIPALIGYASAHGGRLPFGGLGGTLRAIRTPAGAILELPGLGGAALVRVAIGFSAGLFF